MDKATYVVEVYDRREDTQFEGVPLGTDFCFDDFDEAIKFVADVITKHKKYVIFGISNDGA